MAAPPRPSPQVDADAIAQFTVYRSGANVTMKCETCPPGSAGAYGKSFSGPWKLGTLVNLAEQHHREKHPSPEVEAALEARRVAGYSEGPALTECGVPHDGTERAGHSHYRNGTCDLEPSYATGGPA